MSVITPNELHRLAPEHTVVVLSDYPTGTLRTRAFRRNVGGWTWTQQEPEERDDRDLRYTTEQLVATAARNHVVTSVADSSLKLYGLSDVLALPEQSVILTGENYPTLYQFYDDANVFGLDPAVDFTGQEFDRDYTITAAKLWRLHARAGLTLVWWPTELPTPTNLPASRKKKALR